MGDQVRGLEASPPTAAELEALELEAIQAKARYQALETLCLELRERQEAARVSWCRADLALKNARSRAQK